MTSSVRSTRRGVVVGLAVMLLAASCASGSGSDGAGSSDLGDPGDCTVIDMAVSSEKADLLNALAKTFNASSEAKIGDGCVFVRPFSKASGGAAQALADGWRGEGEGPQPVIWSPASSSWGKILDQRLADSGQPAMASDKPVSFQLTPLVIAMPKPMAQALGYPDKPVGWADVAKLATSKDGWAAYGHPEWGAFKLGKTNPNYSTSGLSSLIGQAYATTGKTRGLTSEDLDDPKTQAFARQIESAVVHYGDITGTFLQNWFRTDREGTSLLYASAVAVEEKSVIDYNKGNPDGVLEPGEKLRTPRIPLVAIYPKEGTVYSDSPLYVLDAPWVNSTERAGAAAFIKAIQRPAAQKQILTFGFRPGNPDVAIGSPISSKYGVDPDQPSKLLQVPDPKVMLDLLTKWREQRKGARVLIVLDVSGSMKEPADPENPDGPTKLDLAKKAAVESLDEFKGDDEVGFRIFTTNLGPNQDQNFQDLLPIRPMSQNREPMKSSIRDQFPLNATPLYLSTQDAYQDMVKGYDPTRINAVVLLTDGVNDDDDNIADDRQLSTLLNTLRNGTEGETAKPVRVFTIAYGKEADQDTLQRIAQATNAAAYDASNPETITKVFTAVLSNF
ncbi:MAG: hypothetical protein JWM89_2731 [Acidimicrobiales bacterium]|nr:hypothetical protein [Acidimicrobiales bacterium]